MKPQKPQARKIKSFKLKPKRKGMNNGRIIDNFCTHCLSKLKVVDGAWECTGDRLKVWEDEFLKFDALEEEKKMDYLEQISNKAKFAELYSKWANGALECEYSNMIFSGTTGYKTEIPDPMVVNRMEKNLGRPLTEEELQTVPSISFPDGF